MTRSLDENISLQKRTDIALEHQADLFISIHANAHAEGADALNYHGHMTLYNHIYNEKLAEIILDNLARKTGLPKTKVWERSDLAVLRQTQIPAVMVETAFLMHPEDNWFLLQPEYQQELVLGIANGIKIANVPYEVPVVKEIPQAIRNRILGIKFTLKFSLIKELK